MRAGKESDLAFDSAAKHSSCEPVAQHGPGWEESRGQNCKIDDNRTFEILIALQSLSSHRYATNSPSLSERLETVRQCINYTRRGYRVTDLGSTRTPGGLGIYKASTVSLSCNCHAADASEQSVIARILCLLGSSIAAYYTHNNQSRNYSIHEPSRLKNLDNASTRRCWSIAGWGFSKMKDLMLDGWFLVRCGQGLRVCG